MTVKQIPSQSITIVSLTGHQDYAQGSSYAIQRSYQELQKKIPAERLRCLLISPERPKDCPDYIKHVPCHSFSYLEYNLFVLYSLASLIETDFALIVQNDGFVFNGENWRNEFFEYDYIGAPLSGYIEVSDLQQDGKDSYIFHRRDVWEKYRDSPPENMYEPQNGGFSLRSKALLNILNKLNISLNITPTTLQVENGKCKLKHKTLYHHEDLFLSGCKRKLLEQNGMKFAPSKVASSFAAEDASIARLNGVPLNQILGCHCMSKLVLTKDNLAFMQERMNISNNDIRTNSLCSMLLNAGISIDVPKDFLK
ncbi:hypothetical protein A1D22_08570 [Pasteurellaceae bacterium LFhippo2]|nr:hypothetical protein [Pasteurellaceae bacterium LFhippo2]